MALRTKKAEFRRTEKQRLRMTYEEFLAWSDEDIHAEWVDGEVIVHMPPKHRHQDLQGFLQFIIHGFIHIFRLGKLVSAPFQMKLARSGREPDLLYVSRENLDRLTPDRIEGPADLVIEIISEDSVGRDRGEKFEEYEEAGVREYWLIDSRPNRHRAEFYQLDDIGQYQAILVGKEGVYHSKVLPGFWLKVEWLWQEELPNPLAILGQIVGPNKIMEALQSSR